MKNLVVKNFLTFSIKLILVLSIFNGIFNSLWHIVSTNIFLFILLYVPEIFGKYKIEIPQEFEWILLIFVIATLFLGKLGGIITPIIFGMGMSLVGFMILAILYSSNQIKKNYFLIILFSFNFAVTLGFAIEILKYYLKFLLGQELHSGVYVFTMQTMTFVILGATLSSVFGYLYMKNYLGFIRKFARKFIIKNKIFLKKEEELKEDLKRGEDERQEFKSTLRVNLHTNEIDRKIEYASLKTIVSFLNSSGGNLFLGLKDNGEVLGIKNDRFENIDKFKLHLTNLIKTKIGKRNLRLIEIESFKIGEKKIVKVKCKKSSNPVFLKQENNEESFFIRAGPSSIEIKASELIDYIKRNFHEK